ncbi:hypothetical protein M3147_19075, partial [Agromyces mediolanus]|uniref:hypothetical protein n=1 Tax=Agromyces mediolanus TaxID=41986 RepID=UPI002041390C
RWVFPEHLSTEEEHDATGAHAMAELARILGTRPAVIVAADAPGARHPRPAAWRLLRMRLARDYKPVKEVAMSEFGGVRTIRIFARH